MIESIDGKSSYIWTTNASNLMTCRAIITVTKQIQIPIADGTFRIQAVHGQAMTRNSLIRLLFFDKSVNSIVANGAIIFISVSTNARTNVNISRVIIKFCCCEIIVDCVLLDQLLL